MERVRQPRHLIQLNSCKYRWALDVTKPSADDIAFTAQKEVNVHLSDYLPVREVAFCDPKGVSVGVKVTQVYIYMCPYYVEYINTYVS